ncbi:MAG: T9SS type A sorting domain-containing protein [candidate division Zixibacteria bacterium]|nr:T9SS type A sorting domain-containing protein [candidate division Zixibacteria bacterium]
MKRKILLLTILLISSQVSATVYYIPDDFNTVQEGIDATIDGDTVLVYSGIWDDSINFNGKSILISSINGPYFTELYWVYFSGSEDSLAILQGFKLKRILFPQAGGSPKIIANEISYNYDGITIYAENSSPIFLENIIRDNLGSWDPDMTIYAGSGSIFRGNILLNNRVMADVDMFTLCGGIYGYSVVVSYNLFVRNRATPGWAGALYLNGVVEVENNTITLSESGSELGGGWTVCLSARNESIIRNNIIYGSIYSGGLGFDGNLDSITCGYNLFFENDRGDHNANYLPQEGDLFEDPLFVDPENRDYYLQEDSPCIDAGDPDSPLDPDSTRADIGCYYYHHITDVFEPDSSNSPHKFYLEQNYPNPFNGQTIISYYLSKDSEVELNIINMRGELVAKPVNSHQTVGNHSLIWQGNLTDGTSVATGIYFYELKVSNPHNARSREVKAMILVK